MCDVLVAPHGDFRTPERATFRTRLATEVAALVAEVALRYGHALTVTRQRPHPRA